MLTFGAPRMALLLLLVPGAALLLWWGAHTRRRRLLAWAHPDAAARLARGTAPWRRRVRAGLLLFGLAACAAALVRPRWGYHYEEVLRRGIDLVLVVDVSESMRADDVSPSRLERAKREIADLLDLIEGDRVALVAAAGTSFLQCPLTLDYGAVRSFLPLVDTDLIPTPGTALSAALQTAARALEASGPSRGKAIVLISDGGNLEGDPAPVAGALHDQGITIYTVGIGHPDDAVPIREPDGSLKEFDGQVVTTRLEEGVLTAVAKAGGGVYVRAVTGDLDLEKIYTDIRERHTAAELGRSQRKVYHERFVWPLGLGLLCLALEAGIAERARAATVAALCLLALAPARPAAADVAGDVARGLAAYEREDYPAATAAFAKAHAAAPGDARTQYNVGAAHYQAGRYDAALSAFEDAAADPALRARALYNAGNAAARLGRLDQAVEAYERSLRLDPSDADAKANLELVRGLIQEREHEQAEREQDEQEQQSEQDQDRENGEPQSDEQGADDQGAEGQRAPTEPPEREAQPPEPDPAAEPQPQPGDGEDPPQEPPAAPQVPEESQPAEQTPAGTGAGQPAADPAGMSQAEADQWLQQLPAEDVEALKDFWRRKQPRPPARSRRDW